jgi:hypothetical protein
MGAAIHAASLVDQDSDDAYLLDVTPLSLQVGVAGGLSEPVIERNTPVPIEQTRTFTTARDDQESVTIRVYQGESREASENELLGQFEFSGFQRGRRGEVEIDVTFEINTDGIVNVLASDKATGQQASTRITLSSGLSEGEMQNIMKRGVAGRVVSTEIDAPAAPVGAAPSAAPLAPRADEPALDLGDDDEALPELETDDGDVMLEADDGDVMLEADEDDAIVPFHGREESVDLSVLSAEATPLDETEPDLLISDPVAAQPASPETDETELLPVEENGVEIGDDEMAELSAELDTSDLDALIGEAEPESLFDTEIGDLSGNENEPRD